MKHGIGLKEIATTIFPYPIFASLIPKSAERFNKQRLTPRARKITGWLYRRSRQLAGEVILASLGRNLWFIG